KRPEKRMVRPKASTRTPLKTASASGSAMGRSTSLAGLAGRSEARAGERLGVHDALDGADLVDDDVAQRVEVRPLDLRDEVVLAEEGVELHDLGDLEQGVVDLVLLRGGGADEDEPDGHALRA